MRLIWAHCVQREAIRPLSAVMADDLIRLNKCDTSEHFRETCEQLVTFVSVQCNIGDIYNCIGLKFKYLYVKVCDVVLFILEDAFGERPRGVRKNVYISTITIANPVTI